MDTSRKDIIVEKEELKIKVEQIKDQLNKLIENNLGDVSRPEIIELSQLLDELLIRLIKIS